MKKAISRFVFCCFFATLIGSGIARAETSSDENCIGLNFKELLGSDVKYTGNYYNRDWGYSVDIPVGFIGHGNYSPAPQHGFGIIVSADPIGYVWVDGASNAFELQTSEAAADKYFGYLKGSGKTIISSEKISSRMGELSATRLRVTYDCTHQRELREEVYFAFSSDDTVHQIGLVAEKDVYAKCEQVMEHLLKTWRVSPRSSGDPE